MSTTSCAQAVESFASGESLVSGVLGTGSALPRRVLSNDELSEIVDTSDEWIWKRVGVRSRHVCGADEGTVSLAVDAGRKALEHSGLNAADIDLTILATVTPDQPLPSSSALVQKELGIVGAMAFDLQAACSGFLFGLVTAEALLMAHGMKHALIIGSESLSRVVDWSDRTTCVLFGDGAGAVVLKAPEADDSRLVLGSSLHTDGSNAGLICRPGGAFPAPTLPGSPPMANDGLSPYVHLQGREVFKLGVTAMYSSVLEAIEKADCSLGDIDCFIPHQSNRRMIESVCDKLGNGIADKLVLNLERVGNTSAASIPIALDEAVREGRVQRGDLVLLTAVGGGLTFGSVVLRW